MISEKSLRLIEDYSNRCPKCGSDNIANEDDSDDFSCHHCSHQFSNEDYMDKFHIVALLNQNKAQLDANKVQDMSASEFESFIQEFIDS